VCDRFFCQMPVIRRNLLQQLQDRVHATNSCLAWSLTPTAEDVLEILEGPVPPGQLTDRTWNVVGNPVLVDMLDDPPTSGNLMQCLWDSFRGKQLSAKVTAAGLWTFRPTRDLLNVVQQLEPMIERVVGP
jgi:hypothetical protein